MTPRVLHVLEALEGGTARHLVDIARHATATQHEVVVPPQRIGGLTDETAIGKLRDAGATVHLLEMQRAPWGPRNAPALARLRRLIRSRQPDVVHGHSSIGGLLARVAAAGLHRPRLYTPNGITQVRAGIVVERALRPLTERFIAVSESEGDLAVQLGLIARDRLVVVPNGIEMEAPAGVGLRARLGIEPGTPLVGTISRLVPQKAPEDFVEACAVAVHRCPTACFVLIGGGDLAGPVDEAIARSGLGHRFHRLDSLTGAAGALAELDVFALSSRFEGGPYSPLEAMRAGTAVVLTDVVGSRDAIESGVSGVLVPPGRPDLLGAAIAELVDDPARRARLAEAGRDRVRTHFDVRLMGSRLDELYASLATPS
jgi:glycosyltransferase involved in cell wall biosynthesis